MATKPKYMDEPCYGLNLGDPTPQREFTLKYLIDFYTEFEDKTSFFNNYFQRLAGTSQLQIQIEKGMTEEQIRESWEPGLADYKEMRKRYLLYPETK